MSAQQDTHHWILTIQWQTAGRTMQATFSNRITPEPGITRGDLYLSILDAVRGQAGAPTEVNVLFFALEPDQLGGAK